MTGWQNRIIGQGEESPEELIERANPNNPRLHPERQRDALENILDTVGMISEVIVNKRTGHIIDGHLRIELALSKGEASIPVKYIDLTKDEEKLVIATFDPIAGLAEFDPEILEGLKVDIETAFDFDLGSVFESLDLDLDKISDGVSTQGKRETLASRFIIPPFSVFDTRQGYWQKRKSEWLSLGIQSELGRGDVTPSGSLRDATSLGKDGKTLRGDGKGSVIRGGARKSFRTRFNERGACCK
jgi:hypothetical protein